MARVSINDEYIVNGKLTVKRFFNEDGDLITTGTFATHYYIEEITKLTTYRYTVTGIDVKEEIFGSDDFDIVYNFVADYIEVNSSMSNLTNEDIEKVEKFIYDENGYLIDSNLNIGGI